MGTITSGIGLVSGINTTNIIDQLMKLEAKPKDDLQTRIDATNKQKVAYTTLSTQLTSIKLYATTLKKSSAFTSAVAKSSNEDVLTATTSGSPTPGTYQFQVARLVTTQQSISAGFSDFTGARGLRRVPHWAGIRAIGQPVRPTLGGLGARWMKWLRCARRIPGPFRGTPGAAARARPGTARMPGACRATRTTGRSRRRR